MWYHLRKRRSKVKLNKALPPDFLGKYQQSRSKYVRLMNVYEENLSEALEWTEGVTGRRTRAVVATVSELLTFKENSYQQDIEWTELVNTVVQASPILIKNAGAGWDAGAVSTQTISSGDGYTEYTVPSLTQDVFIGLSNGNTDANFTDIDFGLYTLSSTGILQIYENGAHRGAFGAYVVGDVLRVAVEGGVVKYRKNGTLLYTSLVAPTYPLLVDTSLAQIGAYISDAVLNGDLITWTDLVNTTVAAGPTLVKTSGSGSDWDAGAVSMQTLSSGDGYAEYVIPNLTQYVMFGLSNGNTDASYTGIDFAIYTNWGSNIIQVFENGAFLGSFGSYDAGDVLRVAVEGGVVKYRKNGTLLYTSLVAPTYPLLVDTSFYQMGAYISGAVFSAIRSSPYAVIILETVAETLALTESLNYAITQATIITTTISEALGVSEVLAIEKVTSTTYDVSDTLGLFEQVEVTTVIGTGFIQVNTIEILNFSENAFAVGTYAVGDTLTFSESFGREGTASDTLVLTEDVQAEYPLNDLITLTESATTEYNVAVSDTLNLAEIGHSYTISTCQENFDPEPPLGIRANTTLSYPYSASTNTVTLRNPEFGNKQTQDMSSVIRMTRGGEQITFRDSTWPTIVYLDVSFTRVTRAQRDDFIALLVAAAGDQIKLEDWENRTWKGHIASEPNEVLEILNNEYELRFKFEGALQ